MLWRNCGLALYVCPSVSDVPARGLKCTVCLVEFSNGEQMTQMHCTHLFHPRCILPWLEKVH